MESENYRNESSGQQIGVLSKPGITQKSVQRFEKGLVITSPSLVVDLDGTAWWVDPHFKQILRA